MNFRKSAIVLAGGIVIVCCVLYFSSTSDVEKIEAMYQEYKKQFPGIDDISVEELIELQAREDVVLVDVREPREREVSMIPAATSVEEFEGNLEKYKGMTVVSYCTIGHRSGLYTQKLQARKLRALNLKGSVLSWAHAGLKFVDKQGKETRRVHVCGAKWNLLPEGYRGIW